MNGNGQQAAANTDGRSLDGRVVFYHANTKGTGAAVRFDLKPCSGYKQGCFYMEMAHQNTSGGANGSERHATFDWEHKATVKLGFMDVCQFLMVLEGQHQSLAGDNRGLYHANGAVNTMIALRTNDTRPGYMLALSRKSEAGEQIFKGHIQLSPAEALGLRAVLQAGLFFIAYGMPQAQPARGKKGIVPDACFAA